MSDSISPSSQAAADDAALVDRLRAGDESAFATLIDRYGGSLMRIAMLYVKDPGAAEDVVQETWLGVFRGIDRFESRSSFKTWLFTILANRAKRRGARDARTLVFSNATPEPDAELEDWLQAEFTQSGLWTSLPVDWNVLPEERLARAEIRAAIAGAIETLPPTQRAVITMRDIEGLGSDEVRNVLGLTETNQRVLLHRARMKVRKALEEYLAE